MASTRIVKAFDIVEKVRHGIVVAVANVYGCSATSMVLPSAAVQTTGIKPDAAVAQPYKVLDGFLLATPSATAGGTVAFKAAAQAQGANVRLTYMSQPSMNAALESGAIVGLLSSAPFWAFPVVMGSGSLWIGGPKGDFPAATTPSVLEASRARRPIRR